MTAPKIIADSGAFSAWKQGATIEVDDYIRFIKQNEPLLDCYVNLDVIPGEHGQREWRPEKIAAAAAASYDNLQRMKDAGLCPIPVFHQDEPFECLERYLSDGEPCIALSPYTKAHRQDIIGWLDPCFAILAPDGRPLVKTHGLGVTGPLVLRRYPWTTVDSLTWAKSAGNGRIPIPRYTADGRPDYTLEPQLLIVTDPSDHVPRHLDRVHDYQFDRINHYLNNEVGIKLSAARYSYPARCKVWIKYQRKLAAHCGCEIVFVANLDNLAQLAALAEGQVGSYLFSYWNMRDQPHTALADFAAGRSRSPKSPRKPPKIDWHDGSFYQQWRKLKLHERNLCYADHDLDL
jgi:hypothetical protein